MKIPEELAKELERIAEAEGLSVQDLVARLFWSRYVRGDFRTTYAKAWKYLSR
jgi:hypothetical protein